MRWLRLKLGFILEQIALPVNLFPKHSGGTGAGQTFPTQKGESGNTEGVTVTGKSKIPGSKLHYTLRLKNNPLLLNALPSMPTRAGVLPLQFCQAEAGLQDSGQPCPHSWAGKPHLGSLLGASSKANISVHNPGVGSSAQWL